MTDRILVTAGLPYANGSIHLGHFVEYCQADIYVRALKHLGLNALYICADDTHGTPIELNALKLKISPEELVARYHTEHQRDFAKFDVAFDHFGLTNNAANREVVEDAYARLKKAGQIAEREIDGNWCDEDQRFLPDRFIRGTCPRCGAKEQYGDVCEVCGATYTTTELKEPHCSLCGAAPVIKKSRHVFFCLSRPEHVEFLRKWIDQGALQPDVANYVRTWVEGGLKDWDISRDGPYFGFAIPDMPNKFFYVWLDAPFGYVASSAEWAQEHGAAIDELWRSPNTRIEHFIGKDIVYFHTLFWPAVLNVTGYCLPQKVNVHGMLTINGEKMSKSRGTFINAAVFAEHVDPQALRYFYACKYGSSTDDLDLSLDDFISRVNSELVNKHANLFSRACQFLESRLDNRLGDLPFAAKETRSASTGDGTPLDLARKVIAGCLRIEEAYRAREFSRVIRELSGIADLGNEHMQNQKPWDQLKNDPEAARLTCTLAINVCHALAMYLWPIVPRFAEAGARILNAKIDKMDVGELFALRNRPMGKFERLFDRIEKNAIDAIVESSKQGGPATPKRASAEAGANVVTIDQFGKIEIKVGTVRVAEAVKKSAKLLRLEVDIGEAAPRQVVAGIALSYKPEALVGTQVVVVTNLPPAKLMGLESQAMILAGHDETGLALIRPERPLPIGARIK